MKLFYIFAVDDLINPQNLGVIPVVLQVGMKQLL